MRMVNAEAARIMTFLPDHGHLMHLYAIRQPAWMLFFICIRRWPAGGVSHLAACDCLRATTRFMGMWSMLRAFLRRLYHHHCSGNMAGGSPGRDDAAAYPQPISAGQLGESYKLPDGYVMVWDRPSPLTANTAYSLGFICWTRAASPRPTCSRTWGWQGMLLSSRRMARSSLIRIRRVPRRWLL